MDYSAFDDLTLLQLIQEARRAYHDKRDCAVEWFLGAALYRARRGEFTDRCRLRGFFKRSNTREIIGEHEITCITNRGHERRI